MGLVLVILIVIIIFAVISFMKSGSQSSISTNRVSIKPPAIDESITEEVMFIFDDLVSAIDKINGAKNGFIRLSIGNNQGNGFVEIVGTINAHKGNDIKYYLNTVSLKKLRITKKEVSGEFISNGVAHETHFPGEKAQRYLSRIQDEMRTRTYSSRIKIDQYGSGDCVGCDFDYIFKSW